MKLLPFAIFLITGILLAEPYKVFCSAQNITTNEEAKSITLSGNVMVEMDEIKIYSKEATIQFYINDKYGCGIHFYNKNLENIYIFDAKNQNKIITQRAYLVPCKRKITFDINHILFNESDSVLHKFDYLVYFLDAEKQKNINSFNEQNSKKFEKYNSEFNNAVNSFCTNNLKSIVLETIENTNDYITINIAFYKVKKTNDFENCIHSDLIEEQHTMWIPLSNDWQKIPTNIFSCDSTGFLKELNNNAQKFCLLNIDNEIQNGYFDENTRTNKNRFVVNIEDKQIEDQTKLFINFSYNISEFPDYSIEFNDIPFEKYKFKSFLIGKFQTCKTIDKLNKVPVLGDMPLIRNLFRSTEKINAQLDNYIILSIADENIARGYFFIDVIFHHANDEHYKNNF